MENSKQGNIRREFGENYTSIPSDILRDSRVSCKARGMYATIMGLPKHWSLSVNGLKAVLKEGRDGIYSMLNELDKYGYVTRSQNNVKGCFGEVIYTLHAHPTKDGFIEADIPHTDIPFTDNPCEPLPALPDTEKPYTENPTQYYNTNNNIKQSIIKESVKENAGAKAPTLSRAKTIEERAKIFYNSLVQFVSNPYPKEMVRDFYDYWTEPNKSNTKMRFELERTWSASRRLATWAKHDRNYGRNNAQFSRDEQKSHDEQLRNQAVINAIYEMQCKQQERCKSNTGMSYVSDIS